jgi:hypothetical protein
MSPITNYEGDQEVQHFNHGIVKFGTASCQSKAGESFTETSVRTLRTGYEPGPFDVICSREEKAKTHCGNLHFMSLIEQFSDRYASATQKLDKSSIVSEVIDIVRTKSPHGGFVKGTSDGRWYIVGSSSAREKVGRAFRDFLHPRYRSSADSKKRRRAEITAKMLDDLETLVHSKTYVATRIQSLTDAIEANGRNATSDHYLLTIMTQANCDILSQLKLDQTVLLRTSSKERRII